MNCSGTVRLNPWGALGLGLLIFFVVYFNLGNSSTSLLTLNTVSLKSLLVASIEIAKRGGHEVKKIREMADIGEKSKGKTREGANNPVTEGDMQSHIVMYYGLRKTFPNLPIVSEEHHSSDVDMSKIQLAPIEDPEVDEEVPETDDILLPMNEVTVWIDPLDATQEYTENLLQYVTTMVCIAVRGKPTVGVIYKPFTDEIFWAWWGPNHASKSLQSKRENGEGLKLIVSRSHAGKVKTVAHEAFGEDVSVTPAGGSGYKVLEVVSGRQDVYIHVTLIKKWDLCAGNAILNALGGNMTNLKGVPIDYSSGAQLDARNEGGVLASASKHQELLQKLSNLGDL